MALGSSISSIEIKGYRPFGEFRADVGRLEVLVGANGSGKSSLFEFLMVLRDGMEHELPPGLVVNGSSRQIYHTLGQPQIFWEIEISREKSQLIYEGQLVGPYGQTVVYETVLDTNRPGEVFLDVTGGNGVIHEPGSISSTGEVSFPTDRLGLGLISSRPMVTLLALKETIRNWRFYSSFNIATDKIRQPVITQQDPILAEDASNLSDVLQHLKNEHDGAFEELRKIMRLFVPGFKNLKVKSYGAPGQVMAFWQEEGVDEDLSLADLSDGIFRLLCWTVLCVTPNPPSLICIDEPDQGVHPRTLPILAGLFKKASQRTQIFLATHNSYFLSHFDVENIAVMRKENGEAKFIKPKDSKVLMAMLDDFGSAEIEALHRSEELERLP